MCPQDAPTDQLAYDAELCARLRNAGCQGTEWELFASALYDKAVKITYRWIVERVIFLKCGEWKRPVEPGDIGEWQDDLLRELALETVEDSFILYKSKAILGGRWDVHEGATLFTYFINGVILCFPNVFRRFQRARRRRRREELCDDPSRLDQMGMSDDCNSLSQCTETLKELFDAITVDRQRAVAELYLIEGLSFSQIAIRLNIQNPGSVRSLWSRARREMQKKYEGGKGVGHD